MKKKKIIMTLITLVSLAITVILWFAANRSEIEYEEVKVTVVSSRSVTKKIANSRITVYEVEVKYNGEVYDLKNCHDSYSYIEGRTVTAYLSNGNLYANIEGVRSSTPLSIVYFVFLFATFGMIIGFPIYLSKLKSQGKN